MKKQETPDIKGDMEANKLWKNRKYGRKFLVFDVDKNDIEGIKILASHFNNATDNGFLLMLSPMLEAYRYEKEDSKIKLENKPGVFKRECSVHVNLNTKEKMIKNFKYWKDKHEANGWGKTEATQVDRILKTIGDGELIVDHPNGDKEYFIWSILFWILLEVKLARRIEDI